MMPQNILQHMPNIPRIRYTFHCKSITGLMDWHVKNKYSDNKLWIIMDEKACKEIERKWSKFHIEARHMHLGLTTYVVNSFGAQFATWSMWPIVIVSYNIPPWLTIKKLSSFIIIRGKYKVKNMDVYLAPLIEDSNTLWEDVTMYDISRLIRQREFHMKATLMWTIHDYLGLGECLGIYLYATYYYDYYAI